MSSRENLNSLLELTRARLLEFVRDPAAIFWVFVFPILLAVVLGVAFRNKGPEVAQVAIVGADSSLVEQLETDTIKFLQMNEEDARIELKKSRVEIVVFLQNSPSNKVTYCLDPSRPNALAVRRLVDESLQRHFGRVDVLEVKEEKIEEKGGRYIDFLLPGLIGLNVMGSCMWGLGYAVVDSRRRKLLKRFAVTPMYRANFLAAFFLSRLVFLVLEVAALILAGLLIFDVTVHGSLAALGIVSLLGTFAFSGIALLIAARTESSEVAAGWMNFVQLPMWLMSGSFFAYSRFPQSLHPFIKALPLTALNDSIRAIINDGASITEFGPGMCILGMWGVVSFIVALKVFKWQ